MRDRLARLKYIAGMTHSGEIRDLVLDVAKDIEAEIERLGGNAQTEASITLPPQA